MKTAKPRHSFAFLGVFLLVLVVSPRAGAQAPTQTKARQDGLNGARLIHGTGRPAIENSVLVIEGKQIVAAGKAGAVSIPKDAAVEDVSGKTIMPGIINLHGHLGLSNNGADSAAGHYTEENHAKQLQKNLSFVVAYKGAVWQDAELIFSLRTGPARGQVGGGRVV